MNQFDRQTINKNLKKEIFRVNAVIIKIVSIVHFQNVNGHKILRIRKDYARDPLLKLYILILFNT